MLNDREAMCVPSKYLVTSGNDIKLSESVTKNMFIWMIDLNIIILLLIKYFNLMLDKGAVH